MCYCCREKCVRISMILINALIIVSFKTQIWYLDACFINILSFLTSMSIVAKISYKTALE